MAAKRAQLLRRYETSAANTGNSPSGTPGGPSHTTFGPSHPAFNRVEDLEKKQLQENHRLLKTGFRKLREQHLESTAAATALEERLSTLHENHAQLTIKSQDMERQILRAEQLSQAYEARAQTAEQRVEEAGVRLEESEHRVREVEARLEELERQFHNAEPQTTDTTILVSHNLLAGLAENLKCGICLETYVIPYSLDCRHVFCGPCLVTNFNSNGHACPECRTICRHEPKREFAVQSIISLVFQAQNRELPTPASEGFDINAFAHMYARAREERRNRRVRQQRLQPPGRFGDIGQVNQSLVGATNDAAMDVQNQMVVDSDESDWGPSVDGQVSDEDL